MHVPWWLPFGHVDEIRRDELASIVGKGSEALLIDVREPAEFSASHIDGATNIPIHDLPKNLHRLSQDKSVPVVAICLSGHRSVPACRLLKRAGWENVSSLSGGMISWWRGDLPTVRKSRK